MSPELWALWDRPLRSRDLPPPSPTQDKLLFHPPHTSRHFILWALGVLRHLPLLDARALRGDDGSSAQRPGIHLRELPEEPGCTEGGREWGARDRLDRGE